METLIAVLLAGAVITYIGYPLFRSPTMKEEDEIAPEDSKLDEVLSQKESTLAALAELDFDHAMGNLSEKDYQGLRERYRLKALALLKQEDDIAQSESAREEVSAEPDLAETSPKPQKTASRKHCTSCGAAMNAGDLFCAACGTQSVATGCPGCGAEYGPGDAFCARCGHRLPARSKR